MFLRFYYFFTRKLFLCNKSVKLVLCQLVCHPYGKFRHENHRWAAHMGCSCENPAPISHVIGPCCFPMLISQVKTNENFFNFLWIYLAIYLLFIDYIKVSKITKISIYFHLENQHWKPTWARRGESGTGFSHEHPMWPAHLWFSCMGICCRVAFLACQMYRISPFYYIITMLNITRYIIL